MRHGGMVYVSDGQHSSNTLRHNLVRTAFWLGMLTIGAPWRIPEIICESIAHRIVRLGS